MTVRLRSNAGVSVTVSEETAKRLQASGFEPVEEPKPKRTKKSD